MREDAERDRISEALLDALEEINSLIAEGKRLGLEFHIAKLDEDGLTLGWIEPLSDVGKLHTPRRAIGGSQEGERAE